MISHPIRRGGSWRIWGYFLSDAVGGVKESPAEDSFLFYVGAIIRVIPVDVRGINKLLFEEEV